MPFEITQASKEDAPALSEVFFAAFSDDVNRRMFPPAPDTRAWMIENAFGGKDPAKDSEIFLKITDPSQPDMPVAVAKWIRPLSAAERRESEADPRPAWPVSSDPEICDWFFGMMDEHHHRLMANRPHYFLDILAIHPSFQGRGLGSKLLRWGLARADEDGVEVFLISSPYGRRLYEKHGFETKDSFSRVPGYEYRSMIRPLGG